MPIELEFLSGPRQGEQSFFDSRNITVGSEGHCDIVIPPDGETRLQSRCAAIQLREDGWQIENRGTGTWLVNHDFVEPGEEHHLRSNDIVRMSEFGPDFRFSIRASCDVNLKNEVEPSTSPAKVEKPQGVDEEPQDENDPQVDNQGHDEDGIQSEFDSGYEEEIKSVNETEPAPVGEQPIVVDVIEAETDTTRSTSEDDRELHQQEKLFNPSAVSGVAFKNKPSKRNRIRKKRSVLLEGLKIVLGGILGIGIAILILKFGMDLDPFGIFPPP